MLTSPPPTPEDNNKWSSTSNVAIRFTSWTGTNTLFPFVPSVHIIVWSCSKPKHVAGLLEMKLCTAVLIECAYLFGHTLSTCSLI